VEQSDQRMLIEVEAGEAAEQGLNTLREVVWELTTSRVVQSIFSVQLPTPFQDKRAPLRSWETWPRLNSYSCSVQSYGNSMGGVANTIPF